VCGGWGFCVGLWVWCFLGVFCVNGAFYPGLTNTDSLTCQVIAAKTCRDAASGDTYAHNSYFWIIGSSLFENSWFGPAHTGVPLRSLL
jgi:hypothetical protein